MEMQDERTTSAAGARHPSHDEPATPWSEPGAVRPDSILTGGSLPGPGLTALEVDLLNGLAQGLSEREIALRLMLFEPAVRDALRSIYRKLGVRSRADAIAYAATQREEHLRWTHPHRSPCRSRNGSPSSPTTTRSPT